MERKVGTETVFSDIPLTARNIVNWIQNLTLHHPGYTTAEIKRFQTDLMQEPPFSYPMPIKAEALDKHAEDGRLKPRLAWLLRQATT